MTTFLLTSPATDLRTGRRGTLLLTDRAGTGTEDGGGASLVLTGDPETGLHGPGGDRAVRVADVDWVEVTADRTAAWGGYGSPPPCIVTLHMKDGSDTGYRLSRSNPALLRAVFAEAGWPRAARPAASGLRRLWLASPRLEVGSPPELAPTGTG